MAAERGGRRLATTADGTVAFVDGEIVVRGEEALKELGRLVGSRGKIAKARIEEVLPGWHRVTGIDDVLVTVERLRSRELTAQPNHVLHAHPLVPNPLVPNPLVPNPLVPNPLVPNPLVPNPLVPNPLVPNPLVPNGAVWPEPNRAPESTAAPAPGRAYPVRALSGPGEPPHIVVLDSGITAQRPELLDQKRITGQDDRPDADLFDPDGNLHPADGFLDPVAGHGTFIAGIIEQLAPGCRIDVRKVLEAVGLSDEVKCAQAIADVAAGRGEVKDCKILSLSFGAPVLESPFLLRSAIADARAAGIVVVASAGNTGSPLPHYPAALPGVVAVGALAPGGVAGFTNWGGWVDCAAPGTDLVSSFFLGLQGAEPRRNTVDVDDFDGWARWSGTSFAAPVVVAALAREMVASGCSAREAVERVVHAPHLLRIPGLGTVVNI